MAAPLEEDSRGRAILAITELPYQVNPDALLRKIAELADTGKVPGIADLKDNSSSRTGMRIEVVLKRDAVASVVRNNLYKHTQLQDTFGCNMVALVDGVPRTLPLDGFVRHWVTHQIEVIRRRTEFRLRKKRERLHIVLGLLKAIDAIDEVIALIRRSSDADEAQTGLMQLLDIDELQARAILDMQLRRLTALSRDELQNEHDTLVADIVDLEDILSSEQRKRTIIREELAEIVEKYGDARRSRIIPAEGDMTAEDLIPEEPVVVTITRGGYAPTSTGCRSAAARASAAPSCARTTSSTSSSSPPRTTGSCSSPTAAGSTAPRRTSCPSWRATPRASTWPTCWRSSPTRRSPGC